MISIKAIVAGAILAAFTTLTVASPASPPSPEPSVAPSLESMRGIPKSHVLSTNEIAERFGNILALDGIAPTRVVQPEALAGSRDLETVVIAYYNQPEGGPLQATSTNSSNILPVSESLERRACGDNGDGGCDFVRNRAEDRLCEQLLGDLRGRSANSEFSQGACAFDFRPGFPRPHIAFCCTTWRGGYKVAGWQLANGVESIRNRCRSGGRVSGWINQARLGSHCTAQCLSTVHNGC